MAAQHPINCVEEVSFLYFLKAKSRNATEFMNWNEACAEFKEQNPRVKVTDEKLQKIVISNTIKIGSLTSKMGGRPYGANLIYVFRIPVPVKDRIDFLKDAKFDAENRMVEFAIQKHHVLGEPHTENILNYIFNRSVNYKRTISISDLADGFMQERTQKNTFPVDLDYLKERFLEVCQLIHKDKRSIFNKVKMFMVTGTPMTEAFKKIVTKYRDTIALDDHGRILKYYPGDRKNSLEKTYDAIVSQNTSQQVVSTFSMVLNPGVKSEVAQNTPSTSSQRRTINPEDVPFGHPLSTKRIKLETSAPVTLQPVPSTSTVISPNVLRNVSFSSESSRNSIQHQPIEIIQPKIEEIEVKEEPMDDVSFGFRPAVQQEHAKEFVPKKAVPVQPTTPEGPAPLAALPETINDANTKDLLKALRIGVLSLDSEGLSELLGDINDAIETIGAEEKTPAKKVMQALHVTLEEVTKPSALTEQKERTLWVPNVINSLVRNGKVLLSDGCKDPDLDQLLKKLHSTVKSYEEASSRIPIKIIKRSFGFLMDRILP